jgi:hypothetical protein
MYRRYNVLRNRSSKSGVRLRTAWSPALLNVALAGALALAARSTAGARAPGEQRQPPPAVADLLRDRVPLPPDARYDAALTRLFTPARLEPSLYGVFVTPLAIGQVAAFYRSQPGAARQDDAWRVAASDAMQAIGTSGPYDRLRVARLYTGKPVSLARGSIRRDGVVVASVTLLTPHPNAALDALDASTMIIVFRIPEARR